MGGGGEGREAIFSLGNRRVNKKLLKRNKRIQVYGDSKSSGRGPFILSFTSPHLPPPPSCFILSLTFEFSLFPFFSLRRIKIASGTSSKRGKKEKLKRDRRIWKLLNSAKGKLGPRVGEQQEKKKNYPRWTNPGKLEIWSSKASNETIKRNRSRFRNKNQTFFFFKSDFSLKAERSLILELKTLLVLNPRTL